VPTRFEILYTPLVNSWRGTLSHGILRLFAIHLGADAWRSTPKPATALPREEGDCDGAEKPIRHEQSGECGCRMRRSNRQCPQWIVHQTKRKYCTKAGSGNAEHPLLPPAQLQAKSGPKLGSQKMRGQTAIGHARTESAQRSAVVDGSPWVNPQMSNTLTLFAKNPSIT